MITWKSRASGRGTRHEFLFTLSDPRRRGAGHERESLGITAFVAPTEPSSPDEDDPPYRAPQTAGRDRAVALLRAAIAELRQWHG